MGNVGRTLGPLIGFVRPLSFMIPYACKRPRTEVQALLLDQSRHKIGFVRLNRPGAFEDSCGPVRVSYSCGLYSHCPQLNFYEESC